MPWSSRLRARRPPTRTTWWTLSLRCDGSPTQALRKMSPPWTPLPPRWPRPRCRLILSWSPLIRARRMPMRTPRPQRCLAGPGAAAVHAAIAALQAMLPPPERGHGPATFQRLRARRRPSPLTRSSLRLLAPPPPRGPRRRCALTSPEGRSSAQPRLPRLTEAQRLVAVADAARLAEAQRLDAATALQRSSARPPTLPRSPRPGAPLALLGRGGGVPHRSKRSAPGAPQCRTGNGRPLLDNCAQIWGTYEPLLLC